MREGLGVGLMVGSEVDRDGFLVGIVDGATVGLVGCIVLGLNEKPGLVILHNGRLQMRVNQRPRQSG